MCEPKRSRLPAAAAVAALPVAAVAVRLTSLAEGFALVVFAACAVSLVVLVRLLRPARPRRSAAALPASNIAQAALPAPRKAIEQPRRVLEGNVVDSVRVGKL